MCLCTLPLSCLILEVFQLIDIYARTLPSSLFLTSLSRRIQTCFLISQFVLCYPYIFCASQVLFDNIYACTLLSPLIFTLNLFPDSNHRYLNHLLPLPINYHRCPQVPTIKAARHAYSVFHTTRMSRQAQISKDLFTKWQVDIMAS